MRKPTRRTCKVCKEKFTATFDNVWWCCPEHGAIYALELRAKQKVKEAAKRISEQKEAEKVGRKRRAARRNELKPIRHWVQMTQRAFNDWRREMLLAAGHGCISCGTKAAFAWHAGHYRTTAPHRSSALTRTISGSSAPRATFTNPGTLRRTVPRWLS